MKVTVQSKIAELESRVAALEAQGRVQSTSGRGWGEEAETEWRAVWKAVDAFFERVFGK